MRHSVYALQVEEFFPPCSGQEVIKVEETESSLWGACYSEQRLQAVKHALPVMLDCILVRLGCTGLAIESMLKEGLVTQIEHGQFDAALSNVHTLEAGTGGVVSLRACLRACLRVVDVEQPSCAILLARHCAAAWWLTRQKRCRRPRLIEGRSSYLVSRSLSSRQGTAYPSASPSLRT
jgi:hypothetical protein